MIRWLIPFLIVLATLAGPRIAAQFDDSGAGNSGKAVRDMARERFGAIAVSPGSLSWGSSHDYKSKDGAFKSALDRCASGGAKDCQIKIWFTGTCAALAIAPGNKDGRRYGWGTGRSGTSEEAEKKAMNFCREYGGMNCKIVESLCSEKIPDEY